MNRDVMSTDFKTSSLSDSMNAKQQKSNSISDKTEVYTPNHRTAKAPPTIGNTKMIMSNPSDERRTEVTPRPTIDDAKLIMSNISQKKKIKTTTI